MPQIFAGDPMNALRHIKRRVMRRWEGEQILRHRFREYYGREFDERDCSRFSEKVYRRILSIHDGKWPELTALADKYLVREFVERRVGAGYLIDLLWHGTDPRGIPFADLPAVCVMKPNHTSGDVRLLTMPADEQEVISLAWQWLQKNYYWSGREFQYYRIRPRILVEECLDDGAADGPLDYKIWCFGGKPEIIQMDNRHKTINLFFDRFWTPLPLRYRADSEDRNYAKPAKLEEMLRVSAALSAEFDFVRVDLYCTVDSIKFGELTFTPMAGRLRLRPEEWDQTLGKKWQFVVR